MDQKQPKREHRDRDDPAEDPAQPEPVVRLSEPDSKINGEERVSLGFHGEYASFTESREAVEEATELKSGQLAALAISEVNGPKGSTCGREGNEGT